MHVAFLGWWLSTVSMPAGANGRWETKTRTLDSRRGKNLSDRPEQAGFHSYRDGWQPLPRSSAKLGGLDCAPSAKNHLKGVELPNAWGSLAASPPAVLQALCTIAVVIL